MSDLTKHYLQLIAIAKGWAIKNLAGWCDETHRDLLARHGACEIDGRISASSMNMPQLAAALEDYEKRGWPRVRKFSPSPQPSPTGRGGNSRAVPPRIAMLVKLWGKLGQSGKVQNASRQALLAFCARQMARNVPDLDSLSVPECQAITEALKAWFAR
jgi:hypothetical protein